MRTYTRTTRLSLPLRTVAAVILVVLAAGWTRYAHAENSKAKTFGSANQASQALYEAVKQNNEAAVQSILGAGPELTSSGNEAQDKLNRETFAKKYEEMHRLVREPDGKTILYIGAENWPFPFPLVQDGGKWHFDSEAGTQEVIARDIGRNEIAAIKVCEAFADGSRAGMDVTRDDESIRQFAAGLRNQNEGKANAIPFGGYYFRVVENKPAGGVVVAYPAEYGLTGVMTFVVTPSGSVYENDLGVETVKTAQQVQGTTTGNWVPVREGSM